MSNSKSTCIIYRLYIYITITAVIRFLSNYIIVYNITMYPGPRSWIRFIQREHYITIIITSGEKKLLKCTIIVFVAVKSKMYSRKPTDNDWRNKCVPIRVSVYTGHLGNIKSIDIACRWNVFAVEIVNEVLIQWLETFLICRNHRRRQSCLMRGCSGFPVLVVSTGCLHVSDNN